MPGLTTTQIDQLNADGYLLVKGALDRELDIAPVEREFEGILDRVASELQALFTDLPEPHPALPGPAPVAAAAAPAVRHENAVAERPRGFLDTAAPRIMAVMPFVALALFFTVGGWWWFLLIPAAGALLYGGKHSREGHRAP